MTPDHGPRVLLATSLVSAVLGSIHAFSVFLVPLETAFATSRATVSLTYSLGLVCLTLTVLFGPRLYSRHSPQVLYLIVGTLGAAGALISALAPSIWMVWLGYSLCFGIANGLGYGFGLQFAARANPDHAGWAMGVVTAAYALGAAIAPLGFVYATDAGGFPAAMIALALAISGASLLATALVRGAPYARTPEHHSTTLLPHRQILGLWLAYGTGVASGLMIIGHAAGIATASGFIGWKATAILACCNLVGSLTGGFLADTQSLRRLLAALPLVTAAALITLALAPGLTLAALGLIGFAYGGTIAAYPAAIAQRFPGAEGPRAYGRVFTAWGTAGLLGPWAAGTMFDLSGCYSAALWAASLLALGSAILATRVLGEATGPAP